MEVNGQSRTGWWRVDPATGETIGVMDTGFHEGAGEYTVMENFETSPILNPNWMSAIIRQESERAMSQAGKRFVGFLVAKLMIDLSIMWALSE